MAEEKKKKTKEDLAPKSKQTQAQLQQSIRNQYQLNAAYHDVIQEAVENMTKKLRKPLMDLIDVANESLQLKVSTDEHGNKQVTMDFELSEEELEFLAIKIPTICLYIQEFVNERSLDSTISDYLAEDEVTEKLKTLTGGDAKERLRFAQQQSEVQQLVKIIKKQVYLNLKAYVDRADKIYDGVKKVLDGKNREKGIFTKSNKFSA